MIEDDGIFLVFRDGIEKKVKRYSLQVVNSKYLSSFFEGDTDSSSPIPIPLFDFKEYLIDDSLLPTLNKEEIIEFVKYYHFLDNTSETMLGLMYLFKIFCDENGLREGNSFEEIEFFCKWNFLISTFGDESSFRLFRKIGYFLSCAKVKTFQLHYLQFFLDEEIFPFILLFDGLWKSTSKFGLPQPHLIKVCEVLNRTILRSVITFEDEKYEEAVEPYIQKIKGMYYHEGVVGGDDIYSFEIRDKFNFHNNLMCALFDPNFNLNRAKNKYFIYPYVKILKDLNLKYVLSFHFDTEKNREYTFEKILSVVEYSSNKLFLSEENEKEFIEWVKKDESRIKKLEKNYFWKLRTE